VLGLLHLRHNIGPLEHRDPGKRVARVASDQGLRLLQPSQQHDRVAERRFAGCLFDLFPHVRPAVLDRGDDDGRIEPGIIQQQRDQELEALLRRIEPLCSFSWPAFREPERAKSLQPCA